MKINGKWENSSGSRGRGGYGPPPHPVKDYLFASLALNKYFPHFFASFHSAYYFCNILPIFIVQVQKFSSLALLGISFLNSSKLKVKVLVLGLAFTYFRGVKCTPKPQLLLVTSFDSCNMKTNVVMIFLPILQCKFPIQRHWLTL